MLDKSYAEVKDWLTPETTPGPQGGGPTVSNRIVLAVWLFVLVAGVRWQDVPKELGCSGRKAHRRLKKWQERGIRKKLHARLLEVLRRAGKLALDVAVIDCFHVRAVDGGEAAGPSPLDRRKKLSKPTVLVNQDGLPLVIHTAAYPSTHTMLDWCVRLACRGPTRDVQWHSDSTTAPGSAVTLMR